MHYILATACFQIFITPELDSLKCHTFSFAPVDFSLYKTCWNVSAINNNDNNKILEESARMQLSQV